jgi:hypothetical protein
VLFEDNHHYHCHYHYQHYLYDHYHHYHRYHRARLVRVGECVLLEEVTIGTQWEHDRNMIGA